MVGGFSVTARTTRSAPEKRMAPCNPITETASSPDPTILADRIVDDAGRRTHDAVIHVVGEVGEQVDAPRCCRAGRVAARRWPPPLRRAMPRSARRRRRSGRNPDPRHPVAGAVVHAAGRHHAQHLPHHRAGTTGRPDCGFTPPLASVAAISARSRVAPGPSTVSCNRQRQSPGRRR